MAEIQHIQYDELPVYRFTLPYVDPATSLELPKAQWPALNADDDVRMILKQGDPSVDRAVVLTKVTTGGVTLADRKVDWTPAAPANTVAGTFTFRISVKQADGRSYSHPGAHEDPWTLVIEPSTADTDIHGVA